MARENGFAFDELVPLVDTIPSVHFRHFSSQLVAVTLNEAADSYQLAVAAVAGMALVKELFGLNLFEQNVDRLFLGVANESACVDDDCVTIVLLTVEKDFVS